MLNLHKRLPNNHDKLRLYRAISSLQTDSDFQFFIDFLRSVHQEIDAENRKAVAPQLQWSQGASQFLQELDDLVSNADAYGHQLAEKNKS